MNIIFTIAKKEFQDGLRNRWILLATLLFVILTLSLVFLGSAPVGEVSVGLLSITIVSLTTLAVFIIPLISLILSYNAIVGEVERQTLILTLTLPLKRWHLILGKFFGHITLISIVITIGFCVAFILILILGNNIEINECKAFAALLITSIFLSAVFISIGYLISILVRRQETAAIIAVGVWLFFVLFYDMGLLSTIIFFKGKFVNTEVFNFLLILNPTDAFRIFNLMSFDIVSALSGMNSVASKINLPLYAPLGIIILWIIFPLVIAMEIFEKKEL